jgi:hypothetical protein
MVSTGAAAVAGISNDDASDVVSVFRLRMLSCVKGLAFYVSPE